jgi:hypothetical protein
VWDSTGLYNTIFVVTDSGVIVVDAPPTLGASQIAAIKSVTNQVKIPKKEKRRKRKTQPKREGTLSQNTGLENTIFVVTDSGVIVVDAPPTLGAYQKDAIKSVTNQEKIPKKGKKRKRKTQPKKKQKQIAKNEAPAPYLL